MTQLTAANRKIRFLDEIFNLHFKPLFNNHSRFLILKGGAGSGKSTFIAQKYLIRMLRERDHRFLFVRKVGRSIRESQYQLFKELVYRYSLQDFFRFKDSDLRIECKTTNSVIICKGLDDPEKLKSIQGITGIWIEEATEISKADFRELNRRLRGKQLKYYKQIILSFNPIDEYHWLNEYFFLREHPKATTDHSTYLDNLRFLDRDYIEELESYSDEDITSYKVYTLGEWATFENIIFPGIKFYKEAPENGTVFYGLDFGLKHATALIKCTLKEMALYTEQIIYKGMTNSDLITMLRELDISYNDEIFADGAELQRIEEIKQAGFNVHPAMKGPGSVKDGIDYLKRFDWYVHSESTDLIKEKRTYCYKKDKNDHIIDGEPVKINDHGMDAVRYAVYTYGRKYHTYGSEVIGKGRKGGIRQSRKRERTNRTSKYDKVY